ncbi:TRAP transporter substrate-binding protein [Marispirochaeta aestuarii]|uniref:TRAP transporter substrate-binding protein n=1 Tax=Marispirochaeta aestuarii TaxID=1963862 RepID=UPI0029C6D5EA|nr:TRAP transporter substrate-binding protein [Marispirochaeta aestuarii]
MKKTVVILTVCIFSVMLTASLFAGGGQEGSEGPITLRYAHVGTPNEPQTRYAAELAKAIEEKTEGRVKVQLFPNSQLGGVSEMVDGVKSGSIDMAHHDFASLGKFLENMSVFNAPFLYRDKEHAILATNPGTSPVLRDLNEELIDVAGIRVLGSHFRGARELSANFPVYSPADLKGKKIRGVPLQLWLTMIQGMGAIPTPVEITELHTALMTGVVSGQENPLTNIYAQKFYEVQTHIMMTDHMHSVLATFINEVSWQKIPETDRALIEEALEELAMISIEWSNVDEKDIKQKLMDEGVTFIEEKDGLKIDEFRTAVNAKVREDFPQWVPLIERIQAM